MIKNPDHVSRPYDIAELVADPDVARGFLEDALSFADAAEISEAIGIVARAQGMTMPVNDAAISPDTLTLSTLLTVLKALGFKLSGIERVTPA